MVWVPKKGEALYKENLDTYELSFGNFMPGYIDIEEEGYIPQPILDIDQCYRGSNDSSAAKKRFVFVSKDLWGHTDVDYVPPVGTTTAAAVRNDCNGVDFLTGMEVRDGFLHIISGDNRFTCCKALNTRFSVAGDTAGIIWIHDHTTMAAADHYPAASMDYTPIIRLFLTYNKDGTTVNVLGFRTNGEVVEAVVDLITGFTVVASTMIHDLTDVTYVSGTVLNEAVVDVCQDHAGSGFVLKGEHSLWEFERFLYNPEAQPHWVGTQVVLNWLPNYEEMLAMEWVTNDYALALSSTPVKATWLKRAKYEIAPAIAWTITNKAITYEGMQKWTHMIPFADGTKAILVGIYISNKGLEWKNPPDASSINVDGPRRMGIFIADLTPDADIEPVLLYSMEADSVDSDWDTYEFPYNQANHFGGLQMLQEKYRCEIYRGFRRWGVDEFLLVSSGREDILTVGVRPSAPTITAAGYTSTSNKLTWSPPIESEFSNIAWEVISRCECDGNYGCVWASDVLTDCTYIDNQHPTIGPQERDTLVPDFFTEVGLVTQDEIDDFNPLNDDFPNGRNFWYIMKFISYLNIESTSNPSMTTTKKPIQPVEIKDTKDKNLDWINILTTSRSIKLDWDFTPMGNTGAEDFLMWQVAMFEDQNPTVYAGAWLGFAHYPQPREYMGTAVPWRWILPWTMYPETVGGAAGHAIRCWSGADIFNVSTKSTIVDKKYVRWVNDSVTDVTDKRYSPLLPDTEYVLAVVGWDKGGLWRASAKMTYVPPSPTAYNNLEMIVNRQIVNVRTQAETSFAVECLFENEGDEIFKRWDESLENPVTDLVRVAGSNGGLINGIRAAQEFYVDYEVIIKGVQFWIDSTYGTIPWMAIEIVRDDGTGQPFAVVSPTITINPPYTIGLNAVNFSSPVTLYPGKYFIEFRTLFTSNFNTDGLYLKTLSWPGAYGLDSHGLWQTDNPPAFTWAQTTADDIWMKIILDDSVESMADGFVIESGRVLDFNFNKSTRTDSDEVIFEDRCYIDEDKWNILLGNPLDINYNNGAMEIKTIHGTYLWLQAAPNDFYGIETRSMLIKTRVRYVVPLVAHAWIYIDIHESKVSDPLIYRRGYWVKYDLVTGRVMIDQYKENIAVNTWWDSNTAPAFPGEAASVNGWVDIWIKIVDDTISVYVDSNGYTCEENYNIGNSIAHQTIWRDNLAFYDFSHYGFVCLFIPGGEEIDLNYFKIYGKYDISEIGTEQGSKMIYGDKSDSGYRATMDLEKIYVIEPDELVDYYDAEVTGKDQLNNIDMGFVPAWIDYPEDISQEDYDKQIFDFTVDNAVPEAVLNCPEDVYVGARITIDAIGSNDPENGDLTYYWNFGDGMTENTTTPFVTHTFASAGAFNISLYIVDELGQISNVAVCSINVLSYLEDFVEIAFNAMEYGDEISSLITAMDVSRQTGVTSTKIPDMCGSEVQDAGPGNRIFNISGMHVPPRCCCDTEGEYALMLDLERICQTIYTPEGEEGYVPPTPPVPPVSDCECNVNIYQTEDGPSPPYNMYVGNVGGVVFQQANVFNNADEGDLYVCGISLYVTDISQVITNWIVQVSVQTDDGFGAPDGIILASSQILAMSLTMNAWNKFEFTPPVTSITLAAGVTYWIVIEPVPCPLAEQNDYIQIQYGPADWMNEYELTPDCIPAGAWVGTQFWEVQVILWEGNADCPDPPAPPQVCDQILYQTAGQIWSTVMVGQNTDSPFSQAQPYISGGQDPEDICAVSFFTATKGNNNGPWGVQVSLQTDAGGIPSGIPLLSAIIMYDVIVENDWNLWDFGGSFTTIPGAMYWFVLEPIPCPIGPIPTTDAYVDFQNTQDMIQPPSNYAIECPPTLNWVLPDVPFRAELLMIVWGLS
jgi:hypothetical protein